MGELVTTPQAPRWAPLPTHPPSTYTGSKSRPAPKAENAPPESSHCARRILRRRSLGQVLADRAGLRIVRGVVDAHCHQSQELSGSHSRGDVPKQMHEKVVDGGKGVRRLLLIGLLRQCCASREGDGQGHWKGGFVLLRQGLLQLFESCLAACRSPCCCPCLGPCPLGTRFAANLGQCHPYQSFLSAQ